MLNLSDIRDWLKVQFLDVENGNFYIGRLENKKDKSLGVYPLDRSKDMPLICLGGRNYNSCDIKDVSILLHWNNNAKETEIAAQKLFNTLLELSDSEVIISEHKVYIIEMLENEPVDVGTTNNIYERVIEIRFYYERKEN